MTWMESKNNFGEDTSNEAEVVIDVDEDEPVEDEPQEPDDAD